MLVKYDHRFLLWILRIIQIPVMAGITAHDLYIIGVSSNDVELLRIQTRSSVSNIYSLLPDIPHIKRLHD